MKLTWLEKGIIAALAGLVALMWSLEASAQAPVCNTREYVIETLEARFGEKVVGRGLTSDGSHMFELFVSESGSWSLTVHQPGMPMCIIAAGESWTDVKPVDPVGQPS